MTRIILLNFSVKEAHSIANAGYSVDRGFLGKYGPKGYLPFWAPHPLYEYDILFYNSSTTSELEKEFTERRNLLEETGSSDTLSTLNGTPSVRVSFVGDSTGLNHLLHGGVSFVHLVKAEENVSVFLESSDNAFKIADVQKLISGFKSQIAKVGYFFPARDPYPFHHVPALLSRKGHVVAACYRCAGLLLRSTKSLAAWHERKHQSAPATILPARNRPSSHHSSAARPGRAALESTSKKDPGISNSCE